MNRLRQDFAYALRGLRREPGFALTAVLTLALAVGANTAVFGVVNAVLLRPLPFHQPDRVLWMAPRSTACGLSCETWTVDAYRGFVEQNHSFASVAAYMPFNPAENVRLSTQGEQLPATGVDVSENFFQTLGITPFAGRLFQPADAHSGAAPVALLTYAYWRRQFNSDPHLVGTTIDLDGQPVTVAGILPADFDFGAVFWPGVRVDLFTPAVLDHMINWGNTLSLVGRLRPGVTLAEAQADANGVTARLYFRTTIPVSYGYYRRRPMDLMTLQAHASGALRRPLLFTWCAVGALLLIACVNLANLLLARAARRGPEFALRAALGAGRGRLLRQWMTESLVLAAAGAACGWLIAAALVAYLVHRGSQALPLLAGTRLDATVLLWTCLVAAAAALLFGLLPGWQAAGADPQAGLAEGGGRGMSAGPRHARLRSALAIAQVGLACTLLVAAGLLLRSFLHVLDVDLGFAPAQAATIQVNYDSSADGQRRNSFFERLQAQVAAVPGVEAVGVADYLPLGRNRAWGSVAAKGHTYRPGELPSPLVYMVTPGYIRAMGMRLRGRDFSWSDGPQSERVIILSQAAAQYLWPQGNAIGQIATIAGADRRVIGVLDNVRAASVEGRPGWQVYFPISQEGPNGAEMVVRSALPLTTLGPEVLTALRQVNPDQPAAALQPLAATVDAAESPRRFFALLVAAFAALGLLLAGLGIYGVLSYSVARRTREIGIRMALGASSTRVQRDVMGNALGLAAIGLLAGGAAALAVAQAVRALLYNTTPDDPFTYVLTFGLVAAAALLAAWLPARRAARTPPATALRGE